MPKVRVLSVCCQVTELSSMESTSAVAAHAAHVAIAARARELIRSAAATVRQRRGANAAEDGRGPNCTWTELEQSHINNLRYYHTREFK
eukprot:6208531-Pleurochrysis_carterae.AAC.4